MLYFGKCIPVSLLPFLLLTTAPPIAAGVQLEQPDAAVYDGARSGTEANETKEINKGTADVLPPPAPEAVKPPIEPVIEPAKKSWGFAFRTLLQDQKDIWTSPTRIGKDQLPWLLPLVGATAAMTPFDKRVAGALPNSTTQLNVGKAVSQAGTFYALGGLSASFFLAGRFAGSSRARETGLLSAEALINTQAVVQVMKFAFSRARPDSDTGQGDFFKGGGQSFPSGHSAGAWAMAAVISREYYDNKFVRYGIYALPVAVSAARIGAQRHFVSDVLAGALIGNLIGAFVYGKHHDPALGGAPVERRSRAIPMPGLHVDPGSKTYALSLTWHP
jgi:membrane-associated phospholipid phosphatase